MSIPFRQVLRVGTHVARQKLHGRRRFPLIVELEPLFACNLACSGCGKIQQPAEVLRHRMPVGQAVAAIEECGAPMVSIAGGEPLLHPQIDTMVAELVRRRRHVYLCTNTLLLRGRLDRLDLRPSRFFSFVVHLDGLREQHDASVCREGVFDEVVAAVRELQARGFRVASNSTFSAHHSARSVIHVLDFLNDELAVDQMMISAAYASQKAPDQEHFLGVRQTRELFTAVFADGRRHRWRLNHSPLFLDFLEGKVDYGCTAWAIPSYSLMGWQRPCYLMADGYTQTYRELADTTDWDAYGRGRDERCANCMAHCGYEPTAVLATMGSLKQSLRAVVQR